MSNLGCSGQGTEKICIQTKKVFDACLKQITDEDATLVLTDINPPNPVVPLRFISGRSISTKGIINNLSVTRLADRPRHGRVECDVVIPIEVAYIDANQVEGTGVGNITVHCDVVLFLPEPSIIPFEVEAVVSAVCPEGFFNNLVIVSDELVLNFTVTACLSIILKIVMDVELIIPSFGYAVIPPCTDFANEICSGFFELPLFPQNG